MPIKSDMNRLERPIIIRGQDNRCIHCHRYICRVFHQEDDAIRDERQRREDEEFAARFLTPE